MNEAKPLLAAFYHQSASPSESSDVLAATRAEAYCQARGWTLGEFFHDVSVPLSGAQAPELLRLVLGATYRAFDQVIFCASPSPALLAALERSGVGVVVLNEDFDARAPLSSGCQLLAGKGQAGFDFDRAWRERGWDEGSGEGPSPCGVRGRC